jgi:hypothetical protein
VFGGLKDFGLPGRNIDAVDRIDLQMFWLIRMDIEKAQEDGAINPSKQGQILSSFTKLLLW